MNKFKLEVAEHKWTAVVGLLVRSCAIAACGVFVIGTLPAAAQSSRSAEMWHDELTIKEVVSGKITPFNGHESNIPGDVIADKMSSKADAQALWGPQGGDRYRIHGLRRMWSWLQDNGCRKIQSCNRHACFQAR